MSGTNRGDSISEATGHGGWRGRRDSNPQESVAKRELLLRLAPSAFGDNRAAWGLSLAQAYALRGDTPKTRIYAEEARKAYEAQLGTVRQGEYARGHVLLGLALAYLDRKEEAIREGRRGLALAPVTGRTGAYLQHQLARIYILVGEHEKALDQLEPLLKSPYLLSPGWLGIDPNFDPLLNNPRFQKLVATASTKHLAPAPP